MDNQRIAAAVQSLKQCKSQGLNYYDATQTLAKQGFSQEEIEQASYQFPYSDASMPDPNASNADTNLDQAFSHAVVQQKMVDNAKRTIYKDVGFGLLGGRSMAGRYFGTKAVSDFAALKDLEQNQQGNPNSNNNAAGGTRVFQRNRAVRYFTILALVPLVLFVPYLINLMRGVTPLLSGHNHANLAITSLYIWSLFGCVLYICMAALLLLARKEKTITIGIYIVMGIEVVIYVLVALILRSVPIMAIGAASLLPGYFISRQVGLLSHLHTDK